MLQQLKAGPAAHMKKHDSEVILLRRVKEIQLRVLGFVATTIASALFAVMCLRPMCCSQNMSADGP